MGRLTGVAMIAVIAAIAGCAQKPPVAVAAIEDKVYSVTPEQVNVTAGLVNGELTSMKVTERVEPGTGRIETPAKLSGKLKLTNNSADQSVRLVSGKILYIDSQGQIIKIEEARTEPALKFPSSYNTPDRLDPGQEMLLTVDVDFPAEALKAKRLKDIRVQLVYIPSPYRQQTASFGVSIGGQMTSR